MNAHSKRRTFSSGWIAIAFVAAAAGGLSAGEAERGSEPLTIGWIDTEADWSKGSSAARVGILHVGPWGGGAGLSDRSLVNLAEYRNLKILIVYSDEVTDEGVLHIAKVKSLEAVVFYQCRFTDDGIQPLSSCPSCKQSVSTRRASRTRALTGSLIHFQRRPSRSTNSKTAKCSTRTAVCGPGS